MNRLFVRTLLAILSVVLILVALISVLAVFSVRRSISEWDSTRTSQLEGIAEQVLDHPDTTITVPEDLPLFVFDPAGNLVYSNRPGGARTVSRAQLKPVRSKGQLIGYFQSGQGRFVGDLANARFLESLQQSLLIGLLLSLIVAAAAALLFSRGLSAPAVQLAAQLDRMSRGDLRSEFQHRGAREIAIIGESADRLRRQLVREQELRRQWAHDVTHDLRTPVAAMRAQFEGMLDGVLDRSSERMENVLREIGRVQDLVTDLEELIRLESPEVQLSIESVDLGELVEESVEGFEHAAEKKRIRFEITPLPGRILVDGGLLRRAISNLLSNAIRHCSEGGAIRVSASRTEEAVTIVVSNTGARIPEEDLGRVFDRLFRGEYARTSQGSGLGLTIVRNIVGLHGGGAVIANRADGVAVKLVIPQPPGPRVEQSPGGPESG